MSYSHLANRLRDGDLIIIDGATGTELERRGVPMNPEAWCGVAALEHFNILENIHRDYIHAGAEIITANTYASSRILLEPAGLQDQVQEINCAAINAAKQARKKSGYEDILVAGSLSHRTPLLPGEAKFDPERVPSNEALANASEELANILYEEGCDLILLEMMYHPERMVTVFEAAQKTGLPIWAGFSARSGDNNEVLSFTPERDIPFKNLIQILDDYEVAAAGIMHTPPNLVSEATQILKNNFKGPLYVYPDSGYFKSPKWQFHSVISPEDLYKFVLEWRDMGVQIFGGCCGLSPEHIAQISLLQSRKTVE